MKSIRSVVCGAACGVLVLGTLAVAQQSPRPPRQPAAPRQPTHQPAAQPPHPPAAKPEEKNLVDVAGASDMETLTTFVKAVKAADLVDTLNGAGPFTVFAPTNGAFNKLGKEKLDELMKPENKEQLKQLLMLHVHTGEAIKADGLRKAGTITTGAGRDVHVAPEAGPLKVENAKIVKTNLLAKNGVIHEIDAVIELPELKPG